MSSRNPVLDRAVITYLHPKYLALFIADCFSNVSGKSETGQKIIKFYYDNIPQKDREALMKLYSEMTPEQKKKPNKQEEEK